jgi:1-acyl-sn-glycerol-3-phosphate acyltransferase
MCAMSEQTVFVPGHLPPWGAEALRKFFQFFYWVIAQVHVSGSENIPTLGGFVFASNHLSVLDVPLAFSLLKGNRLATFAGDSWRKNPLTRGVLELVNVIWVRRGETSPSAIKTSIRVLRDGYILGVAPEGTRSQETHALIKGKTGAAYLGAMAGVPILPVAFTNTQNLWSSIKRLRRIEIRIAIGKPFILNGPSNGSRLDADKLDSYTDEIMCRIAALLPEDYRGEYANHPRLKDLLSRGAGQPDK